MKKNLLGSHIPFNKPDKYFEGVEKFMEDIGANCGMIFLGPPQSTKRVDSSIFEYEKSNIDFSKLLVHGPYIVNPASTSKRDFAVEFISKEMKLAEKMGIDNYVIHPGAGVGQPVEESIKNLVWSIKRILKATKKINLNIETMSGKGTEIGVGLDQMKTIIELVDNPRLKICLDTCHLYASGIDLNKEGELIKELKKRKLLKHVGSMHINDSLKELGSNKDRHANLGKGFIKISSLKKLVNTKELSNVIKVLETPWVDGKPIYKQEIKKIK